MADEAILRIVLDDSGRPTVPTSAPPAPPYAQTPAAARQATSYPAGTPTPQSTTTSAPTLAEQKALSKALLRGDAMLWSPSNKPTIQASALSGTSHAREEQARFQAVPDPAQVQTTPPAPPKTAPIPVEVVRPPEPELPPAAAPTAPAMAVPAAAPPITPPVVPPTPPAPSRASLPPSTVAEQIANIESWMPEPGSPAAKKLEQLKASLAEVPVTGGDDLQKGLEKQIADIESWMPQSGSPAHKKLLELRELLARENGLAPPPVVDPPFDPVEVAKKRIEKEEQRVAVEAEYAKLRPPTAVAAFDPIEVAKKRLKKEEERAAADAEYRKLKPPKPPETKSVFDGILEAAESMRGVVGGTFGRVVGAALDITNRIRKFRAGMPTKAEVATGPTADTAEVMAPAPTALQIPVAKVVGEDVGGAGVPGAVPADAAAEGATVAKPAVGGAVKGVAAAEGAASSGAAAASAAATIAVVAGVAAAAIVAVVAVAGEANKMVEKYGQYSPEITQEQAMAEVRKTMGDMRRARESGSELAEFVRAQSVMQEKWEDVKVAVMKQIVPVVTGILEVLSMLLGIAIRTEDEEKDQDPTSVLLNEFPDAQRPFGMQFPDL